jgi:hypothetical protein
MSLRFTRVMAAIGIALTVVGVGYTAAATTGWEPNSGPLFQAVLHLGELAVVLALTGASAVGAGLLGRLGLAVAIVGQVLLSVAELVFPASPNVGNAMFAVAPLLSGLGMIMAGIAVVRAGTWSGVRRLLPLLVGVWILVPATPVMIITGGPPDLLALAVITVWDVLWALTGVAVLTMTGRTKSGAAEVTRATSGQTLFRTTR